MSGTATEIIARIRASLPGTSVTRQDGMWVAAGPWGSAEARLLPDLEMKADERAKGWTPDR